MTHENLEDQLLHLAAAWPMASVAETVMARVENLQVAPARRRLRRGSQFALIASAVAVMVASATWLTFATPRTLQAQVQQALAETEAAHVIISSVDENGVRHQGEIWYSSEHGFRAESPDEIIVDDGKQQLSWRPVAEPGEVIVSRRASGDAISMITESFQFDTIPLGWNRTRASEFDRELNGAACLGYIVTPLAPNVFRLLILTDPQQRIVWVKDQRQANGEWKSGREVSIEYDAPVPPEKFVADFPGGARIVDADGLLDKRFPLDKALATTAAGGLLFAVHDVCRVDGDMFFVLSSVRGTPEYLKQNPPKRRRLNLQVSILDVANQPETPGNGDGYNRATLATAESEGVHYLWWLAISRRYYSIDDGVQTPRNEAPSLEVEPGGVRLPLQAIYRAPRAKWTTAVVEVDLPAELQPTSLVKLAGRVRRDVLSIREDVGALVTMHGGLQDNRMEFLQPGDVTDADFAQAITEQLQWLHSLDEVAWPPEEIGLDSPN